MARCEALYLYLSSAGFWSFSFISVFYRVGCFFVADLGRPGGGKYKPLIQIFYRLLTTHLKCAMANALFPATCCFQQAVLPPNPTRARDWDGATTRYWRDISTVRLGSDRRDVPRMTCEIPCWSMRGVLKLY